MPRGLYIGGKIVWSTIPEINLLTGTPESVDLSAYLYNPRNREVTFSSVGSLPAGCSISGNSLSWNGSGTPAITTVTIRAASNQYQVDASASIDIALGGNSPPEWSQYIGPFNVPSNSTVGYVVATMSDYVTDPEDDTLTITMNGSLPSGLTYNSTTKQVTVTGALTTGNTSNVTFTADDGYVEEAITTLTLNGGSAGKAWTFGHPFKQGDVPSGSYITATGPTSFQADIRNRWSDGSVKYAVLSGVGGTSAELRPTTTAPSGSNVAEPSTTATVQFSSPATTVSLATARANGSMSWSKTTAHKVREILGPVMSEFHYYSPVAGDNHLAVWWYVRAYSNGAVEVETVVENGWLNVASPGQKTYTVTITVGGTQVYSGAITQYHHTRYSRSDWAGADPAVLPQHDGAYLRATKLVPNYGYTSPTSAAWADNPAVDTWDAPLNSTNPTPFARGNFSAAMGDYGYDEGIGLLSRLDALYVTSQNAVAYRSSVGNARCYGRYNLHYRDETTGKPLRFSQPAGNTSYATQLGMSDVAAGIKYGFNDAPIKTPAPSGSAPPTYTPTHAPASAYLPYLITGRWTFLEEVQFAATAHYLLIATSRDGANCRLQSDSGALQSRGAAWSFRTLAHAACITPDGDVLQTEFRNAVSANATFYKNLYVGGSYDNGLSYLADGLSSGESRPWMNDFFVACVGWASDMDVVSSATNLNLWRDWLYEGAVNRLGASGYCFQDAAQYSLRLEPVGQSHVPTNFYADWGTVYTQNSLGPTCTVGGALRGAYYPEGMQMSYWGNFIPAIAYAVTHGAAGASTGYSRLTGASNWSSGISGYHNNPIWGVVPR